VTSIGVGAIVGGVLALRVRPRRPLLASVLYAVPYGFQALAFGLGLPLPVLVAVGALAGGTLSLHLALWFTVFQREVPEHAQSRVSSYDALGSFVLTPLGLVGAGLIATGIGISNALWLAAGSILVLNSIMLLIPSVWRVGRVGSRSQASPIRRACSRGGITEESPATTSVESSRAAVSTMASNTLEDGTTSRCSFLPAFSARATTRLNSFCS